jgi:hypothetical protein
MCESGIMDADNGHHLKCDRRAFLRLGTADLSQIDVRGLSVQKARYPYD